MNRRVETKVMSASKSREGKYFYVSYLCGWERTVKLDAAAGGCRKPTLKLLFLAP